MSDTTPVNDVREMFNGIEAVYNVTDAFNSENGRYFHVSGDKKYKKLFTVMVETASPYELIDIRVRSSGQFIAHISRE